MDNQDVGVLDPTKEVKSFDVDHVSVVSEPANGREFIMIQDENYMMLADALVELLSVVGPMIDKVRSPIRDAILTCQDYLMGKMHKPMPMGEMNMSFVYPDQDKIGSWLLAINGINTDENSESLGEVSGALTELSRFIADYTTEGWTINDNVWYLPSSVLRMKLMEKIVERSLAGLDVSRSAQLVEAIANDDKEGVIVEPDSVIGEILFEGVNPEIVSVISDSEPDSDQDDAIVNNDSASEGVSEEVFAGARSLLDAMFEQCAQPGLNYEQRCGVARFWLDKLGGHLQEQFRIMIVDNWQNDSKPDDANDSGITAEEVTRIIDDRMSLMLEEMRRLRESVEAQQLEAVPQRRSLLPYPKNGPDAGGHKLRATPSELASRGILY